MNTKEEFMAMIAKDATTGCWIWNGAPNQLLWQGKRATVRHVAYLLEKGSIESDPNKHWFMRKTCETGACVAPDHMQVVPYEGARRAGKKGMRKGPGPSVPLVVIDKPNKMTSLINDLVNEATRIDETHSSTVKRCNQIFDRLGKLTDKALDLKSILQGVMEEIDDLKKEQQEVIKAMAVKRTE